MNRLMEAGRKIVSLSRYRSEMHHPALKQIDAYWEGLRTEPKNAGRVPRRADIDPRGIERALHQAFILERIAPGLARLRIAGMHLNDLMGMEVRGMPFTSLFTAPARRRMTEILESVFEGPRKAEIAIVAEKGIGRPALSGRILLLPLRSDLGDVTRILGAFATTGNIGRTPRRFDIAGIEMTDISGEHRAFLRPDGRPAPAHAPAPAPGGADGAGGAGGFAEGPAGFAPPPPPPPPHIPPAKGRPRGRAHLRLVKSED